LSVSGGVRLGAPLVLATLAPSAAFAADTAIVPPLWSGLPFAGILLSIAFGPVFVREWWHINYGKAAAGWAALAIAGLVATTGLWATTHAVLHTLLLDYVPFSLMLFALFTAAGGIAVTRVPAGTPLVNIGLLALGAGLASLIGTTAASMILIRPLIRANAHRSDARHVYVFFIFLVANIGGALTPLGDPPLFMGFLRGVDFFWTVRHLWQPTVVAVVLLLALFWMMELRSPAAPPQDSARGFAVRGLVNLPLIAVAVGAIVTSGLWRPGVVLDVFDVRIELQNVLRDGVLIGVGLLSLGLTARDIRRFNGFDWEPLKEVAKLFAGIFVCLVPVSAMFAAGRDGPFAGGLALLSTRDGTPSDIAFFWATGLLSSFLDNAPTYLVFFALAGGDPAQLMGAFAKTLAAISLGAVYMGANTYIGNAPNFMVYAIARQAGAKAPGFLAYMGWSIAILIPLFVLITLIFLR
jgi:Na+/H+ antiporter NhaD/arsenite permease-like protein